VHTEICCQRTGATEEQQCVEQVEANHEHGMECEVVVEGCGNKVEEREHRNDGQEHGVVDYWGVAGESVSDNASDQCQNQKCP